MFRDLIKRVCSVLKDNGLPYMIIGGQAVLKYGDPRLTQDVDITLGIAPQDGDRLLGILDEIQVTPLCDNPADFLKQTFVLPVKDKVTGIRIDFIFSLTDYELRAIERSSLVDFDGLSVNFISLEDLLVQKLIANRPRDIEDVRNILLKNKNFDRSYVEKWLNIFDGELDLSSLDTFKAIIASIKCKCL